MVWDFAFIYLLHIGIAGCSYFQTVNVSSWNESTEKCDLATPDITFDSNEYRADIQYDDWNEQVWTGYLMAVQGFVYIGCVRIGEEKADFVNQFNTPGFCHSACGTADVIGVHDQECFCLVNGHIGKITQPYCDTICHAQKGIVCGGPQHMSVYKISNVPNVLHDENAENSCLGLAYEQDSKIFKWQGCSEYLRPLCTYVESKTNTSDKHYPWNEASNECFKQQIIPTSYEIAEQFKKVLVGIYWTGTVRSQGIYKYNHGTSGLLETHGHALYGYLTKNPNNVTVVAFTKENKKLKSLCHKKESGHVTSKGSVPVKEIVIGSVVAVILVVIAGIGIYKWRTRNLQPRRRRVADVVGGEVSGARPYNVAEALREQYGS